MINIKTKQLYTYITPDKRLPASLPLPRSVADNRKISDTAKIVYSYLLSRSQLSQRNSDFIDSHGYAYVIYSNSELAQDTHRSISTVKAAMRQLSNNGLIIRKATGRANHIYVLTSDNRADNRLSDRQSSAHQTGSNQPLIYNTNNRYNNRRRVSRNPKRGIERNYDLDSWINRVTADRVDDNNDND